MPRFEVGDGRRFVWVAAVSLAGAILTIATLTAISQREAALERASSEMENVADNVAQDIAVTFELSNTVLVSLRSSIYGSDGTIPEMEAVSGDVAAMAEAAPRLKEVLFAEVGGWVLASSLQKEGTNRNVAREPFFLQAARENSAQGVVAKINSGSGIAMSRGVWASDGTLMGVVASIVPEEHFLKMYSSFDAGRGIRIDLRRLNGQPLLSYGHVATVSSDHVVKRNLAPLPFLVSIRWSRDAMLKDWWQRLPLYVATTIGLVVLVFTVASLLLRLLHRKEEEQKRLTRLASTDPLTALANRRAFMERLDAVIADPSATGFSVVLLDLDRFKVINDTHGHAAGDFVLQTVARRLMRTLGVRSTIARLGGDEFAAVMLGETKAIEPVLVKMHQVLAQTIDWNEFRFGVGASVGVASFPTAGRDGETLLQAADLAMYHAKQNRLSETRFFEPGMDVLRSVRLERERELRCAIERREIRAYYQPLVSLPDRTIKGFELLARWHHPTKGVLPPGEFIALAEEINLITPMTVDLIRQAAADAAEWPEDVRIAINISPRQLREPLLAAQIMEALRAGRLDPSRVEIELTEDGILDDYTLAKSVLSIFRLHGMTLALDDFGTGYSSLSHLRELRFDRIKIDRSFVQALPGNRESGKLVEVVVQLAKSFDMHVTAEGIETEEQAAFLSELKCARGQGYLFGKPMPAHEVVRTIHESRRAA